MNFTLESRDQDPETMGSKAGEKKGQGIVVRDSIVELEECWTWLQTWLLILPQTLASLVILGKST